MSVQFDMRGTLGNPADFTTTIPFSTSLPDANMAQDAVSHQDALRSNGIIKPVAESDTPYIIPEICIDLRRKVIAFLDEKTDNKVLQNVQSQVKVAMKVIEEALSRYG